MNQLVGASEADADLGFMARMMALCSLPRTNPGNRWRYIRQNGPYKLIMISGGNTKLGLKPQLQGGRRSIARNEAEVAKCTKLKRKPQAVCCCPPPDGDEVSVGTRQRECSDQVIARDFLGKAGQPSQLSL